MDKTLEGIRKVMKILKLIEIYDLKFNSYETDEDSSIEIRNLISDYEERISKKINISINTPKMWILVLRDIFEIVEDLDENFKIKDISIINGQLNVEILLDKNEDTQYELSKQIQEIQKLLFDTNMIGK